MPQVIPDALEVEVLTALITPDLTLRLFGNNVTPVGTTTAAAFSEVSGGGYAAKPLTLANWIMASGDPSSATYNAIQEFAFTGTLSGAGTTYGYYITRNSDGKLISSERWAAALVPFNPVNGSIIRVLPKITAQSLF